MVSSDKPAPKRRRKPVSPPASGADPTLDAARREKIASIKRSIEDGTYRVSSDEVARKLIEHMFEPKK